jgi:very-short-patch-repair endonuclease
MDGFEPPVAVEVNVPRGSSRRGSRVHRVPCPDAAEVAGLPITAACQTLLEVGTELRPRARFPDDPRPIAPDELVELALESALRRGLVSEAELENAVALRPTARHGADVLAACLARRPPGAPASESYLETRGVQLLRRVGLPTGRRQVEVRDDRGAFVARVDLLLEDRLVVEFDGREHHAREAAFERDRARWDGIVATGLRLVVFTAEQVERRPRFVAETVAAALGLGGPAQARPGARSPRTGRVRAHASGALPG